MAGGVAGGASHEAKLMRGKPGPAKRLWRAIRGPLAGSAIVKRGLAGAIAAGLRFVAWTNPRLTMDIDPFEVLPGVEPAIYAFWHGQHLLIPALNPKGHRIVAMFSRSADAELNALVVQRFGIDTVRGSGGRDRARSVEKGGARALIALKKALDDGISVAMIADIPHGTPREAGLGVVTLGRISGRPIVPVAFATSRRKVLERSWDKTTINLPFGRSALIVGDPISVPSDADDAAMEGLRRAVTRGLNDATDRAYAIVDGPR